MKYPAIPSAQTMVLYCKSRGIKNIIISPGSRNAPLIIGFSEDSFFNCFSIVDERCAGFFALGMALQQQEPVAVVCTSGSAMVNYYPAVCEAFYSNIPLIVLSADRPEYKIDIGDGQTIRQENLFKNHIGYSANLKLDIVHAFESVNKVKSIALPTQEEIQIFNRTEISKALRLAKTKRLPVHINIPFEEPLYEKVKATEFTVSEEQDDAENEAKLPDIDELARIWNTAKRKMILVGVNHPNQLEKEVIAVLGEDPSVLVFTETTSNLHHPSFFNSIDSIIAPIEKSEDKEARFRTLQPEILITFGGLVVSKKIKAFLRNYQPEHHWHVHPQTSLDTFFTLTEYIPIEANRFLKLLFKKTVLVKSNYQSIWVNIKRSYESKREAYLSKIPFSDFLVFDEIIKSIPINFQVHLSNSSTVRYTQLFDLDQSLKVFCNRGTSGIDGSTSTAIGASVYSKTPTILITGDLSFFYDSNALWNSYIKMDFRIILINNGGGGIFRILPGKEESKNFSTYFETQHELHAKHLCSMYGFTYLQASNGIELDQCLKKFFQTTNKPALLEVFTPTKVNNNILLDYFDFIS